MVGTTMLELAITLPPRGSGTVMRALHRELKSAILDGRLKPGLRLPSTRLLARRWGVSRNTVMGAYDLLLSEGYLTARHGAGTFVSSRHLAPPERTAAASDPVYDERLSPVWRTPQEWTSRWGSAAAPDALFRLGEPDRAHFPFQIWRRLITRSLRASSKSTSAPVEASGRPALREAIAAHVSFARAVAVRPEGVVVTSGTQQAFDLLAKTLLTPTRRTVAIEDPGYAPLRKIFSAAGAHIVDVPVDHEGMRVDLLPADTNVICVTPSNQFPLGVSMSMQRRAQLIEFAQLRGAVIVEDDYDGEFRYGDAPRDALQTLDRTQSVFYLGTFSKSMYPGIRMGFVVAPPWARRALVRAKRYSDWMSPTLEQEALAAFIGEGHMARHVRRMRRIYAERRDALVRGLQAHFGQWLTPLASSGGMHLTALARPALQAADLDSIAASAQRDGLDVRSLQSFCLGSARRSGLVLGFGATDLDGIALGLGRLRRYFPSAAANRISLATHPQRVSG